MHPSFIAIQNYLLLFIFRTRRYIDIFQGREPRTVIAKHYTERGFERLKRARDDPENLIPFSGILRALGSAFPHQMGDIEHAVERIMRLDVTEEEKEKIL